jgi:hypothetical protein
MLTQLRCPIRLTFGSTDFLLAAETETVGTLYQIEQDRFHLVMTEPLVIESHDLFTVPDTAIALANIPTPRLLWLDFSPYRVTMTMQGNGQFSYRHLFEPGVFGLSRYWLQDDTLGRDRQFRLRNFTRSLCVKGNPLPIFLLLNYELWAGDLLLGEYTLTLEMQH